MKVDLLFKKFFYSCFRIIFKNKSVEAPLNKDRIKNILILRYDAIGDMIVTLPTIRMLRQLLPNANIDIICSQRNISIIENEHLVRNIIIQPVGFFKSLIQSSKLRKNNYDIILSLVLNDTTKAGLIANLAGSRETIKALIEHNERQNIYSALFNLQISMDEYRNKITMLEIQCIFVAKIFGLQDYEYLISNTLRISEEDKLFAQTINKGISPYIVYNISSGNDFRTFSKAKNLNLLTSILKEFQEYNIIIIYAPIDQPKAMEIKDSFRNQRVFVFKPMKLNQVSALIDSAEYVFTPDTSIVHIASATQTPVFLIYSLLSSHFTEWLPYKSKFAFIKTEVRGPIEDIDTDEIFNSFVNFVRGDDENSL